MSPARTCSTLRCTTVCCTSLPHAQALCVLCHHMALSYHDARDKAMAMVRNGDVLEYLRRRIILSWLAMVHPFFSSNDCASLLRVSANPAGYYSCIAINILLCRTAVCHCCDSRNVESDARLLSQCHQADFRGWFGSQKENIKTRVFLFFTDAMDTSPWRKQRSHHRGTPSERHS